MKIQDFISAMRRKLGWSTLGNPWRTRPFSLTDLAPVPNDFRVASPDFVGIGGVRCGTSWWYELLSEHPAVYPNRLQEKELSFFFHFGTSDIPPEAVSAYCHAFAAPPGGICGEWTPGYLCYPLAIRHLAQAAPETKLLAIVRNPVDRFFSAVNHRRDLADADLGLRGTRSYLHETFSVFQVMIAHGLYADAFQRLLKKFKPSQLLVLQYEQCVRDPASQISKTYRFLGIDDAFVPSGLQRRVNASQQLERPTTTQRARLAEYFQDDVNDLMNMFPELDSSLWTDFC